MNRIIFIFFFISGIYCSPVSALPWEIWNSPYQLATLDANDRVLLRSSYCLDGCRYDRSNVGPEPPGANLYPLRWLYQDGAEAVVFEDSGSGAITRIWMTTGFGVSQTLPATVRVRFYFDGASIPTLDLPLAALFDGSTAPFTAPIALDRLASSGGYVNYFPISYASGVRVSLLNADNLLLWFQFHYHRLPLGTPVNTFVPGVDASPWRNFLSHQGDDPWNGALPAQTSSTTLAPGASLSLATQADPGWLRGLRLKLPRSAYAAVRLQISFDGELRVDAPLSDFFATPVTAATPARSVLLGEDISGWLYEWIPMPFRTQASVALVADSTLSTPTVVESSLHWDNAAIGPNVALFKTIITDSCPTTVGQDNILFSQHGAGRIIAIAATYHAHGTPTREYLEGDERAYVDGSRHPAWYGTGVEDFYNGGFYFDQGTYGQALSGVPQLDNNGSSMTTAYRLLLSDYLPYQSQLTLAQESGATGLLPMCARTTIHAYTQSTLQLIPYARLEVGDPVATARYAYQPPANTTCSVLNSRYSDEPPTSRTASVCRFTNGNSSFHFKLQEAAAPLRLRRLYDASIPGQKAEVWVNGTLAGIFPYTQSNPVRRWQEQEIVLNTPVNSTDFQIEIRPLYAQSDGTTEFSESAYELWGGWVDGIFSNGFEAAPP